LHDGQNDIAPAVVVLDLVPTRTRRAGLLVSIASALAAAAVIARGSS
jgi:hypothetical protein